MVSSRGISLGSLTTRQGRLWSGWLTQKEFDKIFVDFSSHIALLELFVFSTVLLVFLFVCLGFHFVVLLWAFVCFLVLLVFLLD